MKRGTPEHPKVLQLTEELVKAMPDSELWLRQAVALSVLERLWHWTAKFAPAGDVGRWGDEAIAQGVGFGGDPCALICALVCAGWLDKGLEGVKRDGTPKTHRLVVHDWNEHCEDAVHLTLLRKTEFFANGQVPNMSKLNKDSRPKVEAKYKNMRRNAQECAKTRTALADADALADAYALADAEAEGAAHGVRMNGSESGSASAVLRTLGLTGNGKDLTVATVQRLVKVTGEGEGYRAWWAAVYGLLDELGQVDVLEEALDYAEKCADPVQREKKGLGELKKPGAYIASKCRDALHASGKRLPKAPDGATVKARAP